MPRYDRQLIVDGFKLDTPRQRARFLTAKAKAKVLPLPTESVLLPRAGQPSLLSKRFQLTAALGKLGKHSRIYLIGQAAGRTRRSAASRRRPGSIRSSPAGSSRSR